MCKFKIKSRLTVCLQYSLAADAGASLLCKRHETSDL